MPLMLQGGEDIRCPLSPARSNLKITLPLRKASLGLAMEAVGSLAWGFWLGLLLSWAALGKERASLGPGVAGLLSGASSCAPPTPRTGSPEGNKELELYNRLFANYDNTRWPAQRVGEVLKVYLRLTLTNLISLVGGAFPHPWREGETRGLREN